MNIKDIEKFKKAGASSVDLEVISYLKVVISVDKGVDPNDIYEVENEIINKYPDEEIDFHLNTSS